MEENCFPQFRFIAENMRIVLKPNPVIVTKMVGLCYPIELLAVRSKLHHVSSSSCMLLYDQDTEHQERG